MKSEKDLFYLARHGETFLTRGLNIAVGLTAQTLI
jgi:hypothetical protein